MKKEKLTQVIVPQVALVSVLLTMACGQFTSVSTFVPHGGSSSKDTASSGHAPIDTPPKGVETLDFQGYVLNAFGVTVDGQPYSDLEAYYTSELARLPALAKAAGYDSSYSIAFDANVGFADLWTEMTVYIAPSSNHGYQGGSQVDANGKFSVQLPANAVDANYQVRANKRIGVVITKGSETHNVCYNFSAENLSVPFTAGAQPIILRSFSSSLTAYDCVSESNQGLSIPANAPAPLSALLQKGMSKNDVLNILGRNDLSIHSNNIWCWNPVAASAVCATTMASDCMCSITFDSGNKVSEQSNINAKFLDVTKW